MLKEELQKIFKSKKRKRKINPNGKTVITPGFENITFEEFLKWFNIEKFNRGCYYCGTTNEKSFELYQKRPHATRGGKRGKRLELDRKNPLLHYDELSNLVWCCYWCNNAKSNFFSIEEFFPIGTAIGNALSKIKSSKQ